MNFDKEFAEQNRRINSQLRWEKARLFFGGIYKAGVLACAGVLLFLIGKALNTW